MLASRTFFRMFQRSPQSGFTLLEILLAIGVVLVVSAAAIPAMRNFGTPEPAGTLAQWDAWAGEAHERSATERRAYVIVWDRDGTVRLRPAQALNEADARGLRQWKPCKNEEIRVSFPLALGKVDDAQRRWTFWPEGGCEAVRLTYHGPRENWIASYDPLTCRREAVRHD